VRVDSIQKWNDTFAPYGFHPAAMCPSYGLAEHTVGLLSWGIKVVPAADGNGLLHATGHWGCQGEEEGDAVFVDPDTLELKQPGQVGFKSIISLPSFFFLFYPRIRQTLLIYTEKLEKWQIYFSQIGYFVIVFVSFCFSLCWF
jgi:hypothetical protein